MACVRPESCNVLYKEANASHLYGILDRSLGPSDALLSVARIRSN